MSKIHISRDRQSLGHFFPGEVAVGLRTGRFLPSDLGWQDPMETWKPLAEFTDLPDVEPEPEVLPPAPEIPASAAPSPGPTGEPPWEQAGFAEMPARLIETIGEIYARPSATFRGLNPQTSIARAFVYYLLLATFSVWVSVAYDVLFAIMAPDALPKHPITGKAIPSSVIALIFVLKAVIAPFFLAGIAFVAAGFLHMFLMLSGVREPNFMVTVRVYCYAVGTAFLMMLIPVCGGLVFLPISIVLLIVGLKEAHRTDIARPAIAVILPAAAFVFLYGLMLLLAGVVK